MVVYPYYFILACGIIGFIYPMTKYRTWSPAQKSFCLYVLISLCIMAVGSAWAVERLYESVNTNLRYIAIYIPLILLFCFLSKKNSRGKNAEKPDRFQLIISGSISVFVILCTVILGCKAGAPGDDAYGLLSLSVLNNKSMPQSSQTLGGIIIISLCILFFVLGYLRKRIIDSVCLRVFAVFMVINGVLGYSFLHDKYHPDTARDGMEIHQLTGGKEYLYLLSDEGIIDLGVDVNSRNNNCFVFLNDFILVLQKSMGVYTPFIPAKMRGMSEVAITPRTDTIVLDYSSKSLLNFSEYTSVSTTKSDHVVYAVHFEPEKRLLQSSIGGLKRRVLDPGDPGILSYFEEEHFGEPLTVRMDIESDADQTMSINHVHEKYYVNLVAGRAWYEIPFNKAEKTFNFIPEEAKIKVYDFEIIRPSE